MGLIWYPLLTAAAFYLGSRAAITSWLWLRYPARLASFMDCAACSGFWYGLIAACALRLPLPGLPDAWWAPGLVGLGSLVWTPILAAVHQRALGDLGSAISDPEGSV